MTMVYPEHVMPPLNKIFSKAYNNIANNKRQLQFVDGIHRTEAL
jgi:hypothetical protein